MKIKGKYYYQLNIRPHSKNGYSVVLVSKTEIDDEAELVEKARKANCLEDGDEKVAHLADETMMMPCDFTDSPCKPVDVSKIKVMKKYIETDYGTTLSDKSVSDLDVAVRVKLNKSIPPNKGYPYIFVKGNGKLVKPTDEPPFISAKRAVQVIRKLTEEKIVEMVKADFGREVTPIEVRMVTELD